MLLVFTLLWKRRYIARCCSQGHGGNRNYSTLVEMNDLDNDFEMPEINTFRSSSSAIRVDIAGEPRGTTASYEDEIPPNFPTR